MNVSFDKKEVGSQWPLIRFLMDDSTYYRRYVDHLRTLTDGPLAVDAIAKHVDRLRSAVSPHAASLGGAAALDSAFSTLNAQIKDRIAAARAFIASA